MVKKVILGASLLLFFDLDFYYLAAIVITANQANPMRPLRMLALRATG
jgi:hypothetical protein